METEEEKQKMKKRREKLKKGEKKMESKTEEERGGILFTHLRTMGTNIMLQADLLLQAGINRFKT